VFGVWCSLLGRGLCVGWVCWVGGGWGGGFGETDDSDRIEHRARDLCLLQRYPKVAKKRNCNFPCTQQQPPNPTEQKRKKHNTHPKHHPQPDKRNPTPSTKNSLLHSDREAVREVPPSRPRHDRNHVGARGSVLVRLKNAQLLSSRRRVALILGKLAKVSSGIIIS